MLKKVSFWRGLSGLFIGLTVFLIFVTMIAYQYASVINRQFGIQTSKSVRASDEELDTEYYKSDFGEINAENLLKVEAAAEAQTVAEAEEGVVLLKNNDVHGSPALPLSVSTDNKVSLFGFATYNPLYRTDAACTRVIDHNPERVVDLKKALENAGFDVNQKLFDAYASLDKSRKELTLGFSFQDEEGVEFYAAQTSSLDGYRDVAIVMLSRMAGEGTDMSVDQSVKDGVKYRKFTEDQEKNSLALQTNEKAMLNYVKEQGFGKVIVLINTNYQMELGWLDDYDVDACMFIGTPGLTGFTGVVNVLKGESGLAPSGKLVDTFAANSLSSPAIVNAAGNTPQWANYKTSTYNTENIVKDVEQDTSWVSVQQESIYVGYKYYETRYADTVTGDGGAVSSIGSIDGEAWNYGKEICYPFGFGLSYTTFSQTITGVKKNADNTYIVSVRVENTGSVAAKDVVQIYVQTPYGDYEKERKIEKPAILFVGFGKTDIVRPGAANAVTIDVEVEEYLFASYDYVDTKGYVLTEGDYYFAIGEDCHDALNNILGARGYTGLTDKDGTSVTAREKTTYKWHMDLDTTTYHYGENGVVVTNCFDKMDINYWEGNSVKYLTRSDWSGTFPKGSAKAYMLGTEMATLLQGELYKKAEDAPSTDIYAQGKSNDWKGVDNGIPFVSMRNVAYNDDEKWNLFLDQFDLADLVKMTGSQSNNKPITSNSINIIGKSAGDGCQGVGDEPYSTNLTGGKDYWPCLYTSVLACTFNRELIASRGNLMANQALFLNQTVIWTGGGNLHRTPYGGRQAEYYSEDANLCYIVGSIELPEMEKKGILGGIKHFAGNDQESHREGLNTFYNEQAFREGALRGFEGALRKGKVNAVMQAFNRQGLVFSSACYELNIEVLRNEWGFEGEIITDASSGVTSGYKSHYTTTIANGTNIYCLDGEAVGGGIIAKYIQENDDGTLLGHLRDAARHTAYALSRSSAINGLAEDSIVIEITPAWKVLLIIAVVFVCLLAIASVTMLVITKIRAHETRKVINFLNWKVIFNIVLFVLGIVIFNLYWNYATSAYGLMQAWVLRLLFLIIMGEQVLFFIDNDYAVIIVPALAMGALGLFAYSPPETIGSIVDYFQNIVMFGNPDNFGIILAIVILMLIMSVITIVACFIRRKDKAPKPLEPKK